MINANSILSMMPLAEKLTLNNINLAENKISSIISPLVVNSVLPGVQYTKDTVYKELQNTTANNNYDEILNKIKDEFTEVISGYIFNLKNYINPFSKLVLNGVEEALDGSNNPESFIYNKLTINFKSSYFWVFDNSYYPDSKPEAGDIDFNTYTTEFLQGNYSPIPDGKWVIDYVGDVNEEINKLLMDSSDGAAKLFNELFKTEGSEPLKINFNKYTGICPFKLMGVLILLSKMEQTDDPFPLVNNVSLEIYRNNISTMKKLVTNLLFETKKYFEVKAITPINVELNNTELKNINGITTLYGDVTVYLNKPIDELNLPEEISLSEVIVGYVYECILSNTRQNPPLKFNPSDREQNRIYFEEYVGKYKQLLNNVSVAVSENITEIAYKKVYDKLVSFRDDYPEFTDALNALSGDNIHYKLVDNLQPELEVLKRQIGDVLSKCKEDSQVSENLSKMIREKVLFSSLLKRMGVILGMEKTIQLLIDCENDQSEDINLTLVKAVIDFIIKRL